MDHVHEHELHRMDDDGGRPADVPPIRIGIAPSAESDAERPNAPSPTLLGTQKPPELILPPSAEPRPTFTWADYVAWRKTKCPERSLEIEVERLADLDQATHEFVGEVAELGELFLGHGPAAFYSAERTKLIDECGDIFFCACWALDAWGHNPLAEAGDDLELVRLADDNPTLAFTEALASRPLAQIVANAPFVSLLGGVIFQAMLHAQTFAGLTANSCKKQVYQQRPQDVEMQVGRIIRTLVSINQILILANSSVEEALTVNQRKLNARYPTGYTKGGGIRASEGK